ncbi:hypothetical protein [Mucilaginibacter sp.]|uniref:hypothetical protein n=1 Tax=Mucilaginibacter sp. TaxID=1882438 RepID=UPI00262D5135|nr:hypothetical protein [Mucilaginibacter sp.]MDB5126850.1 FtsX-like permease family protein [Mucilaginibacter sp.]
MLFTFHISFYDIVFFGAVIISLTLSLFLWIAPKENQSANRSLAALMTVVALWIIRILATDIDLAKYGPLWNRLPLRFSMAIGPMIYFYVRQIAQPKYTFRRKDLLHFIPLLPELSVQVFAAIQKTKTTQAICYRLFPQSIVS